MTHWLCWLCIFGFGLFRAFLSLGPSCWRNCLVLYALRISKRLLGTRRSRWKILAFSLYSSAILIWWHAVKSTSSPASFGTLESSRWMSQTWETKWRMAVDSNTFLQTLKANRIFPTFGMSCSCALCRLTICSDQESNIFSLIKRNIKKALCLD